jgi:hypothetical protein
MALVVQLTPEQDAEIQPLMEQIRKMGDEGKPGMLVAQVFPGHMRLGVVSNERAQQIAAAGGPIRYAPELDALDAARSDE